LRDQATRKYGEAVQLWMHVKAVRTFVECVLRYGIPVNFVAAIFTLPKGESMRSVSCGAPHALIAAGKAKPLMEAIMTAWHSFASSRGGVLDDNYGPAGAGVSKAQAAKEAEADNMIIPGVTDGSGAPSFPFVFFDFDIKSNSAESKTSS
jgi:hypothetical protein